MTEPTTTARTPEAVSDAVECAIGLNVDCGGTAGVHRVRDAVLAALQPELDALAALRAVARGYCPTCGRGDAAPTVEDWEQQRDRAERAEAERDHLAAAANPADVAVRAIQLMQETGRERDAFSTGLREARTTNQRLNRRTQELESELATYRRAVAQWEINERGTYIPHASLRAIGLASGKDILGSVRHLRHFERVEQAEVAIARVRALAERLNDELASDTDQAYARAILTALDQPAPAAAPQASGERCSARLAWTGSAKEALLEAEQQQWADAAGLSRADEDEAADVYEEMLRRVEASGPRPAATVPSVDRPTPEAGRPRPMCDADLLAWAVVLECRRQQQCDGITILLLPFPRCPTCQQAVHEAETVMRIDRFGQLLTMRPCNHVHSIDDMAMQRIYHHARNMLDVLDAAARRPAGGKAWNTHRIITEAKARVERSDA